ncbi:PQQ-binding-like beta-propeller repeat protein [Streptomyces sp. NPDC058326]|uniref:outer membrane protein assembly factor BamB family protein n=1 Tax=Streptomyces sp. NPDC058326 TaxID=3346447 RepID=UPI0036E36A32
MIRDGVPGALFGAAVVFLGAGAVGGAWPTGWAALACAVVLIAVGVTVRAARRGGTDPVAPVAERQDAVPHGHADTAKTDSGTSASQGRSSLVAAAVVWVLALLAAGVWGLAAGDDEGGRGGGAAPPTASGSPSADREPAVAWTVPGAGQRYDHGVGSWGLGTTVAHGRIDGLFAYDGADGTVRWSVPAPAREALCAMTPGVGEGVGLVAHGRHDKPCATLLAVRAADGKVLWKRNLGGGGLVGGALAVGGATAVTAEDRAVRARSAESGEQRWQRAVAKGCGIRALGADATRTLLVEQCGKGARLLALDTRTGAQRWARDLPVESTASASVVSVSPAVLAVDEADTRGTHAFLGFDDGGAPTVSVPLTGPEGVLSGLWNVRGGRTVRPLVLDGLLVTLATSDSTSPNTVVAYSLKDGRKVWAHAGDAQMMALATEPDGRVAYLGYDATVTLLDRATGKVRGVLTPGTDKRSEVSIYPELVPVPGGHVVLNQVLVQTEPAAFALR